jgi:hypothetical protein
MGLSADGTQLLVDDRRLTDADFGGERGDAEGAALLFATGVRPDEPAVAHVMAHVLQEQRGAPAGLRETTDATLSASAWREGEANLVALLLLYGGLGMEADVLAGRIEPASFRGGDLQSPEAARGSSVLRRLLEFVYGDGYRAAAAAVREGGWRSLERAAAASGNTTPVPTPDLAVPEPLVLADRDSIGAYGVGVLVAEGAGKENLGWIAADGWKADALFRWEGPGAADGVTLWITRWSTEADAGEFRYALERTLASRFPAGGGEGAGPERVVAAGGKTFRLAASGREVRLRVAPDPIDAGLGTILPNDSTTNTTK